MTLPALGVIAVIALLIPWVLTDVLHVPRAVYLAGLMVATAGLTYGYLAWSGTDPVAFFTGRWLLRGIPMPPYSKGLADAPEEADLPVAA
jgi:hypothetical protein